MAFYPPNTKVPFVLAEYPRWLFLCQEESVRWSTVGAIGPCTSAEKASAFLQLIHLSLTLALTNQNPDKWQLPLGLLLSAIPCTQCFPSCCTCPAPLPVHTTTYMQMDEEKDEGREMERDALELPRLGDVEASFQA